MWLIKKQAMKLHQPKTALEHACERIMLLPFQGIVYSFVHKLYFGMEYWHKMIDEEFHAYTSTT